MNAAHQNSPRTFVCSERKPKHLFALWAMASGIAFAASVIAPDALAQVPAKKPNILVIFGDDIGM